MYTVQPITDFSIFTTPPAERKGIQFKASWSKTARDLERELAYLDATDVIVEIAVSAGDIRLDGELRANARPSHPGVRLSFQSKHGSLSYTCDTYEAAYYGQMPDWQANVRAIVLTLEALRAVDRYGATKGEQYAGFKALGAGTGGIALGGMTREQAEDVIATWDPEAYHPDASKRFKRARAAAHPDRNNGDQTGWDQVELAAKVLGLS
jgi:hypothetical protein